MPDDSPPLPRAMMILGGAALTVMIGVWFAAQSGVMIGPAWAAMGHGTLCALIAWRLRLPWWWRVIVAGFAPMVVVALVIQPPLWIWPTALGLFVLIFWSVFKTRVPLYLSGPAEWEALLAILPTSSFRLLDVGSGLGGPLFWLAQRRIDGIYTGVEIAPLPWLAGRLRACMASKPRPTMILGDAARVDLAPYDVVFAFLSPAAMPHLFTQMSQQMRPGSILVSCAFEVPGQQPDQVISVPGGRDLLLWRRT